MPRFTRTPSYRLHKPTGQAAVTLNGRAHYLGRHGSPASRERYDALIAEWLAGGRKLPDEDGQPTWRVTHTSSLTSLGRDRCAADPTAHRSARRKLESEDDRAPQSSQRLLFGK